MVQAGLNMGPWHAHVLGWAKSFTKNLNSEDRIMQDQEVISAMSPMWNLIQSAVPLEISEHVMDCLKEESLPTLATRDVKTGE